MTRSVPEWIGATPDTSIPPRVRVRIFNRDGGCMTCRREMAPGDKWQVDHIVALVNGGENRERNLEVICDGCHKKKTAADVAVKAKTYAQRMTHLGFRPTSKRPMPHGKNSPTKRKVTGEVVRR